MIRLGIVDDHKLFIDGLSLILSKEIDFELVFAVTKPTEVLKYLNEKVIDILITDISMPEMNGIELIKEVKAKIPEIKIVVMSAFEEMHSKNEVDAYLLKNSEKDKLISVLKDLYHKNKKYYYSNEICYNHFNFKKKILSNREKQIVIEICNGLSSDEISKKLFISINTVETHRKNIFFKLNINNAAQLVGLAIKLGILNH